MRAHSLMLISTLVGALAGCRGQESKVPPIHLILNMDTQEKGKAYREDTSDVFADGRVMRAPVPGTVAIGQLGESDRLEAGLEDDGQITLKFPDEVKVGGALPATLAARGQLRYNIYCTPCHGSDLDGKGVMTQTGYDSNPRLIIPPPSFHSTRLKNMPVGQIYVAIKNGVNGGNMPSYAAQIPLMDRWAIIAYVRQQQKAKDATVEPEGGKIMVVAAADVASVDHGSQLYEAKGCAACHTLDGNRLVGPSFKGLFGKMENTTEGETMVDMAYLHESIREPAAKIVMGYPPAMPKLPLTDIEVDSLAMFIESQK